MNILKTLIPDWLKSSTRALRRKAKVARSAKIFGSKNIRLGLNVDIGEYAILKTFVGMIEIGDDSQIGPFTVMYGGDSGIKIGKCVMVAPHVMFAAGSHDFHQTAVPMRWADGSSKGPIIVDDDVWIGAHCVICDGVRIATGCVIAAGAIVTKSTEPYGIYAGVPAKNIGSRSQ